jgi:hypothetical protein
MIEVGRLREVLPFLRRRQLVGLHIALVPHDAVARGREAGIEAVLVVHRIGADLLGDAGRLGLIGRQQLLALQHLEGIGRRGPEQVDLVVALGFLDELHAGVGIAVLHFQRGARHGLLEGFLDRIGDVLGEGRDDRHLAGLREGGAGGEHETQGRTEGKGRAAEHGVSLL